MPNNLPPLLPKSKPSGSIAHVASNTSPERHLSNIQAGIEILNQVPTVPKFDYSNPPPTLLPKSGKCLASKDAVNIIDKIFQSLVTSPYQDVDKDQKSNNNIYHTLVTYLDELDKMCTESQLKEAMIFEQWKMSHKEWINENQAMLSDQMPKFILAAIDNYCINTANRSECLKLIITALASEGIINFNNKLDKKLGGFLDELNSTHSSLATVYAANVIEHSRQEAEKYINHINGAVDAPPNEYFA